MLVKARKSWYLSKRLSTCLNRGRQRAASMRKPSVSTTNCFSANGKSSSPTTRGAAARRPSVFLFKKVGLPRPIALLPFALLKERFAPVPVGSPHSENAAQRAISKGAAGYVSLTPRIVPVIRLPVRGRKKTATLVSGGGNLEILLPNLVYAIPSLGLPGLDLEAVLLGGGSPLSAVRSVPGFSPPCSRRAACWRPWRGRAWRPSFRPWLPSSARLWLCGHGAFLALGRALLLGGALLRGGLLRRNVRALFGNGSGVFGCSSFCVRHSGESFLRLVGA
jgi:hypothetical protein